MALAKTIVEMPLAGGLDQKADKFITKGLTTAQNMVMNKSGQMNKRNGYSALTTDVFFDSIFLTDGYAMGGNAIYSYDNKLIVAGKSEIESQYPGASTNYANNYLGGNSMLTLSETDNWMDTGDTYKQVTFNMETMSAGGELRDPIAAIGAGYYVCSYMNDDELMLIINDHKTGKRIKELNFGDLKEMRSIIFMKDASGDEYFLAFMISHTYGLGSPPAKVRVWKIKVDDIYKYTAANIPYSLLDSDYDNVSDIFDAVHVEMPAGQDDLVWYGYVEATNFYVHYLTVDATGTKINDYYDTDAKLWNALGMAAVTNDAGSTLYFAVTLDYTSGDVYCKSRDNTFGAGTEVTDTPMTGVTDEWTKIALSKDPRSDNQSREWDTIRVWVQYYNGGTSPNTDQDFEYNVMSFEMNWDGSKPYYQLENVMVNHTLESRPFIHNGSVYIVAAHNQTTQKTNYLVGAHGYYARIDYGRASGKRNHFSDILEHEGRFVFPMTHQTRLLSDGIISSAIVNTTIDFDPVALQSAKVGNSLFITGAMPFTYSAKPEVYGFNWFPEMSWLGSSYTSGGVLSDGVYYYKTIYEYVDDNGSVHRSYPSNQMTVTLAGGGSTQGANVYAPALAYPDELDRAVTVVFYRTEAGGGNYHRVAEVLMDQTSILNYVHLDFDTVADADLLDNELLYTSGGILGDISPSACNMVVVKNNRAFINNLADPNVVFYSKANVAGLALEFPEEFQIRIDEGGSITGLGTMDDKIIVFKQDKIFYFQGEGPNALGAGQFSPIYPLATDVGCVDANSVITTSIGIMFKSEKGIYLLGRGLDTKYIGASVENYNAFNVLQAVLVDDQNQIRYTLSGGQPTLVYDYYHNIWTTFTNHNAIDACMHDGAYHWLGSDGTVHKEDDTFTDGSFVIPAIIETPWFKTGSLQSFLRVYRMELIGKYRSKHTLNVGVYLDYNETTPIHTFRFDATTNYVSGDPLQFVGRISRKCQSIKFKVYDTDSHDTYESFELTAIGLEVGTKGGLYKQPKTKKI